MYVPSNTMSSATMVNVVKSNLEVVQTKKPSQKTQMQEAVKPNGEVDKGMTRNNAPRGSVVDMLV